MTRNNQQNGFILLPVVLAIALTAVIAFMLNNQGVLEVDAGAGEAEIKKAEYVTKAGMEHATWGVQNSNCGGDMSMSSVPFGPSGANSYSATATTGGSSIAYSLSADQDAWIDSGSTGSNTGSDTILKIKGKSIDLEQPLVRFDLSSLPAGAQINSAIASFYIKKEHPQGPVTVHRVGNNWVEASVTWNSISSSIDTSVLAMIPPQPQKDVWVQVNITAQVQAWMNGETNNGILLASNFENVDGEYISREGVSNQRPRLDVVVGTGPASPAVIQATGTLASGVTRTLSRTVAGYQPASGGFFEPVGDAFIKEDDVNKNFGVSESLWVEDSVGNTQGDNSLLKFAMGRIPPGARITSAKLEIFAHTNNSTGTGSSIGVHRVTRDWVEGTNNGSSGTGVTWNDSKPGTSWSTGGGDYDAVAVVTTNTPTGIRDWYQWDVTSLVNGWVAGTYPNQGLILLAGNATTLVGFKSRQHSDVNDRPRLTVTYACECGKPCLAPQGTGKILMVIADFLTPRAVDVFKKALFESWGYQVNFFWDASLQLSYDSAFATHDVVYVSETVLPLTVGNKLVNAPIGVINEEGEQGDELGFASGRAWPVGRQVSIVNNSHYITLPFKSGPLDIYSADMEGLTVSGTEAPGLQTLADWGSAGSLVVLDQGVQMQSGGTTAGRRVMLPLGREGETNVNHINNNGWLIVQRALAWGMKADVNSGKLLFVVGEVSSLTTEEVAHKNLVESWGYLVELIDEDAIQAQFNTALVGNDVVLVTNDVNSGDLNTKLVNASIGVVTSEVNLSDEFGLSAGVAWSSGTKVEIIDNTHYITSPFSTGLLTILSGSEALAYITGSYSTELRLLASLTSGYGVVTLDAGAAMYPSGNAAGRRVQLPWGGNGFNPNNLTNDGKTILQRALAWGAGASLAASPQTILLVVPDATTLGAQDTVKKTLIESWGYTVTLITAADSQANFDAAVATSDVAYISEEALSNDTGTKLREATIGVVIEEEKITDEFGISSGETTFTGASIEVTDNTHYITQPFGLGAVTFASSAQPVGGRAGTLAPGLEVLALRPSVITSMLDVIETGGVLFDTGSAAGRRVKLPWGGDGFDINSLTADGKTLMQRAIEWGMGTSVPVVGPMAHWKLDDGTGTTAIDSEGGHDGTLINGPTWVAGQIGDALNFDGANDYVNVGTFDVVGSGLTMMGWFKADALPDAVDPRIISKASSTAENDAWWQLSILTSGTNRNIRLRTRAGGTTSTLTDTSNNLNTGQWYFAVGTYHAATGDMKLYLNGTEVASQTHPVGGAIDTDATIPVAIGANGSAEQFFDGILDDVRIYNYALGAGDISDFYTAGGGSGGSCQVDPNGTYIEAEHYRPPLVDGVNNYRLVAGSSTAGANGNAYLESVGGTTESTPTGQRADYPVTIPVSGTYYIWLRANDGSGGGDSTFWGVDGSMVGSLTQAGSEWNWTRNLQLGGNSVFLSAGNHTINLWPREDGQLTDGILISTSPNPLGLSEGSTIGVPVGATVVNPNSCGGGCNGTYRDGFDNVAFNGSNGTIDWSGTPWSELGESDGAGSGDILIKTDTGPGRPPYSLQIQDNDNGGEGVARLVNISGAGSASLSFNYRREGLDGTSDYVSVSVSSNGLSGPWTELPWPRIEGAGTDSNYVAYSRNLSDYIGVNTAIRLLGSPNLGNSDRVYFDDIKVSCSP